MAEVIELVEWIDPEQVRGRPGVYAAASDTEAYGPLLALVEAGAAEFLGEHIEPNGVKIVAVRVGKQRNPSIGISREFFTTVLKDYDDWPQKWWREAIQNSVDAGATRIVCSVVQNPDGTFTVAAEDDGRGMDESILLDKFLMLGGSTKQLGSGAAGGFGKAKELLILPWLKWAIHTRDRRVEGSGIDYVVQEAPHLRGTRIEVVMPADQHTSAAAAIAFIEKSFLPDVRFEVRQDTEWEKSVKRPKANLRGENLIDTVPGKMDMYVTEVDYTASRIYVRVNGLFMFEKYMSSVPGKQIIAEITAPSIEILTANRDGFRDWQTRALVDDVTERVAKDVLSAFRKKAGLMREKFRGAGKFAAERAQAAALAQIGPIAPTRGGKTAMDDADVAVVSAIVDEYRRSQEAAGQNTTLPNRELAHELLTSVTYNGAHHVEEAVKQLAWEPDFFVINDIEGFRVPAKFLPATMRPRVVKLARTWTELCRFVLMQLGNFCPFGVGWIFAENSAAAYLHDDGEDWLLLNPFVDLQERKKTWTPTSVDDLKWLYAAAVHECTHLADGIDYHDEAFASALTRNIAKTADGFRKVRKIVNSIRMKEGAVVDVPTQDNPAALRRRLLR